MACFPVLELTEVGRFQSVEEESLDLQPPTAVMGGCLLKAILQESAGSIAP